jgi:hypothetical protein
MLGLFLCPVPEKRAHSGKHDCGHPENPKGKRITIQRKQKGEKS